MNNQESMISQMIVDEEPSFRTALREAWSPALGTVFVYALTLTVFPGTVLAGGMDWITNPSWEVWFIVTIYNICDTISRFASPLLLRFSQRTILVLVYARVVFFVTTYLLALKIEPASVFQADWARILNTILLGLSHGFTSIVLILVPMNCSDKHKSKGGMLGGISLLMGVCIGCFLASFLMNNIVPHAEDT